MDTNSSGHNTLKSDEVPTSSDEHSGDKDIATPSIPFPVRSGDERWPIRDQSNAKEFLIDIWIIEIPDEEQGTKPCFFMLKNKYISRDDVRDNTAVVIRKMELAGGVVLQDIVLQYEASQDSPVILCLRDLERLGRVAINEKKRVIEIR